MINKVILVGNVGAEPEVRALESGVKVARIRLATTERYTDRNTNETKEETEWHSIDLFRNLADVVDKYVRKGDRLYIEGKIKTRQYKDKDGHERYATTILANELKMLTAKATKSQTQVVQSVESELSSPLLVPEIPAPADKLPF